MTLLLALDTSTRTASVALFDGAEILSETTWQAGREHSTRLLVEARDALARVGWTTADLTGLVVARGPGSFTGVRVAVSVAKGLAAALDVPLWGVSSLDVVAHAVDPADLPVRAVLEAGRGRVATALYQGERCVEPARLATLDELLGLVHGPTLVAGELSAELRHRLDEHAFARVASAAVGLRRAGLLAELGWRQAQRGDAGDPRLVDAVYAT